MLKTVELPYIFVETKYDKNMIFFLIEHLQYMKYIFCSIINFVIVTFDKFNVLAE